MVQESTAWATFSKTFRLTENCIRDMTILVTGGAGMLGHKVVQQLAPLHDVWWTLRGRVDDPCLSVVPMLRGDHALQGIDAQGDGMTNVVRELRPNVVVNCVGVIKQATVVSADTTMLVNAQLPHRIADALKSYGGRLIHISTDCVFSGLRGNYAEDDLPDATDLYGRSKADGEVIADHVLTLRTSMIGRELRRHQSLLDWFLRQQGKQIRGFRRAIWSGVTTIQLAQLIERLIVDHPRLAGTFHLSSGRTSKFALLVELKNRYHLDVEIEPDDSVVCDRSLIGTRFERATGYHCPPLSVLIDEMIADPTPYPTLS